MTTINDLFPSPYLAASDVEHSPTVTVKAFQKKTMKNRDGDDEVKPVIYFNEFDKGMVLNKTNADIIASLYGNVLENWVGERVQLQSVIVEAFGKRQPAIRVSDRKPLADKATLLDRFAKLYEKAVSLGVEGVENYKIAPNMPDSEIIELGKELKAKVEAAEQF